MLPPPSPCHLIPVLPKTPCQILEPITYFLPPKILCVVRHICVYAACYAFLVRIESLESVEFGVTYLVSKISGEAEMT